MSKFLIRCKTGECFCPKKQLFIHVSKAHRYGTRAMAVKSLNAALAKNPELSRLDPYIQSVAE